MLNVLINAYSVGPNAGSELGMGWNWVINIANHCNVFVITEGECKNEILEAIERLPQKNNLHFYFNPLPDKVRAMCRNQGDWRFYWYYRKWQQKTLGIAREIIAKNHIDVMHQLNMIGFREPGYLWKIKDIPLVWGPVGGIANIPTAYLKGAGWKMKLFCRLKNFISDMQFRYHPRVRSAVKRSTMIAAMKEVQTATKMVYGKDIPVINETGTYPSEEEAVCIESHGSSLNVLWVGKFDYRKRLDIALKAVAATTNSRIHLYICGTGTPGQIKEFHNLAKTLNIESQVSWLGEVPHDRIPSLMRSSDLLLFTSISDATSTVVLEAISVGLPILSFNICGFGPIVQDFAGTSIGMSDPGQSIHDFAAQLTYFYNNRNELDRISVQERTNAYKLSWEYKCKQISKIYRSAILGGVILWIPEYYKGKLNILWVGKFDFRKQFFLALNSVSMIQDKKGIMLHVVAPMTSEQETQIMRWIEDLNLSGYVTLYGRIPHDDVQKLMRESDILLFTSLSEGTPHVVLEAVKNQLPIICFDICGQGEVVDEMVGLKVDPTNFNDSASRFSQALDALRYDRRKRISMINNCSIKQKQCSWDNKIRKVVDLYEKSLP